MNNYQTDLFRDKQMGFLIYLGVEMVMFLTLFAVYIIFTPSTEGPRPSEVFNATTVIVSSVFLLSSSGTLIMSEQGLKDKNIKKIISWLAVTLVFGLIFLGIEINEFREFVSNGYTLSTSSFLGSYFVLVGLHAAHVLFGIGWMILLIIQLLGIKMPFSLFTEKLKVFSYYWHFVDIIWVFIIIIVYSRYLF